MSKRSLHFDNETSGIFIWGEPSGGDNQPHIVSLAAQLVEDDSQEVVGELDVIIKPEGWSWDEDDEAFKVHGITMEQAMDVGIPEDQAISAFMDLHHICDRRVAFNTTFDNRCIRVGLKRYYTDELADKFKADPYYCTMVNSRKVMGGKNPKLTAAYKHFTGLDLESNHNAMADTIASKEIYFHLIKDEGELDAV